MPVYIDVGLVRLNRESWCWDGLGWDKRRLYGGEERV